MIEIEINVGDVIGIGDEVEISLEQIRSEKVAIGVVAPRALRILRLPRYDEPPAYSAPDHRAPVPTAPRKQRHLPNQARRRQRVALAEPWSVLVGTARGFRLGLFPARGSGTLNAGALAYQLPDRAKAECADARARAGALHQLRELGARLKLVGRQL